MLCMSIMLSQCCQSNPALFRPHAFKAVYTVSLHGELLRTDLRIINTGDKPFEFTAALHTYIEVEHIKKATVKGLKDLEYLDKVSPQLHLMTQQ